MKYFKKLLPFLVILLLIIIVKNNISATLDSLHKVDTKDDLEKELEAETKENKYLQERLKYVNTEQFIEDQAKEKLGLLKPGEYFVIAPTSTPLNKQAIEYKNYPNWKKWFELFF